MSVEELNWTVDLIDFEDGKKVRFQVLTAASMMFRVVFWDILSDDGGSTHL
jgi:hypothetical protein